MQQGSERANFEDVNEVLRSVIGYVSKLLNTRRGSSVLDEEFGIRSSEYRTSPASASATAATTSRASKRKSRAS